MVVIDPLFNRRPVNVFHMSPSAPGKFMDDHFLQPSEARKSISLDKLGGFQKQKLYK